MDVPDRGTSSAFLLLAFNIGIILCQNVGQECPFSVTHQGEVYNEYNSGIAILQPPKTNIRFYPAKRPPIGIKGAKAECQKPSIQENVYATLNPQTLSPTEPCPPCFGPGPVNKQSHSDLLCSTESCNGQRAAYPYSEPILNPSPCPEPPITPYAPQNPAQFEVQGPHHLQPFSHGSISSGPCSPLSFKNNDRPLQTPVNDVECPQQSPPISTNNAFTSLSVPMLRKIFTPLVPYPNSRLPLPSAANQPSPFPQVPSIPVEPLNNLGCLASQVDVLPTQQSREQDNPMVNYPPLNLETEQILPSPPVNCLPQSPAIEPCDTLPECQPCSSIIPCLSSIDPFQDHSALFPCDQCKVTRSLCSCPASSCQACQPACHSSVCNDEPSLFQIDTCLQVPHNIPSCVCNENCPPHRPYSDFRQSLSLKSGCCSSKNNDFFMPQPGCTPQSCCMTQTCGTSTECFGPLPPQFSCNCSPPCSTCDSPSSTPVCLPSCESPCQPEPINVQINVPPPIIPAPSITIINAAPEPAPTSIDSDYFDMSPVIIDSRRRRSKSWLPLLLVWLFSCDGFGGFGGCGGECDSGPIPVPFPIPIPT